MGHQAAIAELCVLATCALGACSYEDGPSKGASSATSSLAPEMGDHRSSSETAAVERFESHFEALNDACNAADWSRAQAVLRTANADWRSIAPVEVSAGTRPALIDDITLNLGIAERTTANRERRPCASEAEGLSLAATKLGPPAPAGEAHRVRLRVWLHRLDTDGRYRDFDAASRDVARAATEWRQFESSPRSGDASTIEAALAACQGAVDERAHVPLRHAAHAALDALDRENATRGFIAR